MSGRAEGCGCGAIVTPGQGEEDEDEEEEEEERLVSWKSFCSWLLTMLFMALCISANILCFSRFGIRPKRTAVREEEEETATPLQIRAAVTAVC